MPRRSTVGSDVAEIEREISQLMRDLEARLGRLSQLTRRGTNHAASDAGDFVSDTIAEAAERLRERAAEATERVRDGATQAGARMRNGAQALGDEASRLGNDALQRIEDEVGQRPLLTLAIAAGIGFLAGMAGRRH